MKITTGISKDIMRRLHENAGKTVPSQYKFTIEIDDKKYDATMYCYAIYVGKTYRNPNTGSSEYNIDSKTTINKIKVYNFDDIEKIMQLEAEIVFKVDDKDYYIEDIEMHKLKEGNLITLIAMNTNTF